MSKLCRVKCKQSKNWPKKIAKWQNKTKICRKINIFVAFFSTLQFLIPNSPQNGKNMWKNIFENYQYFCCLFCQLCKSQKLTPPKMKKTCRKDTNMYFGNFFKGKVEVKGQ